MQRMDYVLKLFEEKGHLEYAGEGVSQIAHAWQCAKLAANGGATDALRLAAWLHDIGHLMTELPGSPSLYGVDDAHETMAAACVEAIWGSAVSEPIRLHVPAKRYLVARVPGYYRRLSEDSQRSLALQGGPMSPADCALFESSPYALDATQLRAWDDAAKRKGWFPQPASKVLEELQALMSRVPQSTLQ